MNIVDVGVLTDAVLGNQSPCGGTIKINDLEDNSVSAVLCWVTNGLQKPPFDDQSGSLWCA